MIPVSQPVLGGKELEYVRDCIESGWISSSGGYVERFEHVWAEYCGSKFGVAVSNGTAALQIAVDALRIGPGDEVIMPSFTIISCALAVVRAGAKPVLVDCDPATYGMDVDQAANAITSRTRAIMPVHVFGHPVNMDALFDLADRHGLAIIEDAAEAHGSEYLSRRGGREDWRKCGSMGTVSTFSFYSNKLITTGEGGMILTDDAKLAERCRSLSNLCLKVPRFEHDEFGYNCRFTSLQAAVGVAQVERMPEILARKRAIGESYRSQLGGVREIKLPTVRAWARVNYWMYAIVLEDGVGMDAVTFADRLRAKGVESRPFFLGMHQQPVFKTMGVFDGSSFPVTERLRERGLYLPSGASLTTAQTRAVADAIKSVFPG